MCNVSVLDIVYWNVSRHCYLEELLEYWNVNAMVETAHLVAMQHIFASGLVNFII